MSSVFERVVSRLFGSTGQADDADQSLVEETTEALVETVEPRVRLRSGYRDKLSDNVRRTIVHLRALGERLPHVPLLLSRAAWSDDPHIRAFFAAANEVPSCIGGCEELREFFDSHAQCAEAHMLLGMQRTERQVLAPRLEGDVLRQDVAQTTVSFSGHRLLAPAADMAQTRLEIGRRIMQRLAELVLARVVNIDQQVQDLQQQKARLGTRLRMLRSAREGMRPLVNQGLTIEEQIRDIERQLQATTEEYSDARSNLTTLDGYIDHINAVFGQPEAYVALARAPLRVTRMGVKAEAGSSDAADDLDLAELSIGDGLQATIAFVRIPRDELPPKQDLLAQALRAL